MSDDLRVDHLFDDHLVVAAGRHTTWARRRSIDLGELANEPWILPPPGRLIRALMAQTFAAQSLAMPHVSLTTYSVPLILHFLGTGPFITVAWRSILSLHAERQLVRALPVDFPVIPRPVVVVTVKNRTLSPLVERFIECAVEVAGSFGGPGSRPRRGHKVAV
jgi:DNA-binding transcriptional LysR family regulator